MISDLSKIKKIRSKKIFTISLAESCTGGMISKYLTSINGSSLFFNGACISYSNQMKTRLLKVPKNTIINYGAVSHQTALAMVKGLKAITDSEILLSVTGVAGPSGGTARTPVGCVFFGIGSLSLIVESKTEICLQPSSINKFTNFIIGENLVSPELVLNE